MTTAKAINMTNTKMIPPITPPATGPEANELAGSCVHSMLV